MSQTNRSRWRFNFRRKGQAAGQQGGSFVTQEQLSNAMKDIKNDLQDQRNYETGLYYRSLAFSWGNASVDFQGAADEWKQYRSEELRSYYTEPNTGTRANHGVRYFADKFPDDKLFPGACQSMAHLIPNDPSCSLVWLRALSIVTGIDVSEDVDSPLLDEKLRSFVEGDGEAPLKPGDVNENVPLKAWNWNFLMLPEDHENHFDKVARNNKEQIILSPIWDPTEEWSPGTGYKLMVAASPETYKWLLGTEMLTEESPQYQWFGVASEGEPEMATNFLSLTVRALADLLVEHGEDDLKGLVEEQKVAYQYEKEEEKKGKKDNEIVRDDTRLESIFRNNQGAIPPDLLSQRSFHTNDSASASEKPNEKLHRKKAQAFVGNIKAIAKVREKKLVGHERKNVQIPVFQRTGSTKPILVIDLGIYFRGKEHLIPDPFLVALKAAVSWSSFRDQKLLPACGKHPDHQSGSDAQKEESIPFEIFSTAGEDTASGDDDSLSSLSEVLTGSPGDWTFEEVSTVSPSGKPTAKSSVVTP